MATRSFIAAVAISGLAAIVLAQATVAPPRESAEAETVSYTHLTLPTNREV